MDTLIIITSISFAGPLIGSYFGVLKKYSDCQVFYLLSFAAGVMLSVSLFELLPESVDQGSVLSAAGGFLSGAALMLALNAGWPHFHHSQHSFKLGQGKLKRAVYSLLLGITIHNLPEGMAVGIGAMSGSGLSYIIAISIALHDIPETICVAAPLFSLTRRKLYSFFLSVMTAIPTFMGIYFAYFLFQDIPSEIMSLLMGFTAGVMVFISAVEILPAIFSGHKISFFKIASAMSAGVFVVLASRLILG